MSIVDGPFIEAKEEIGGYGLIDVPNLDAAIEMARSWPWGGVVEIRPVIETMGPGKLAVTRAGTWPAADRDG